MKIIFYIPFFTVLKVISTQMLPYAMPGASGIGSAVSNLPALISGNGPLAGHGLQPSNIPLSSGYTQAPANMAAGSYMSNPNLANAITNANVANTKLANLENAAVSGPVSGNSPAAVANINAVKAANAILAAENVAANLNSGNYENVLTNTDDAKLLSNLSPVLNGNMATFYLGNNGNTFTVTSGSPGTQGIGVQVMADALEVGGTVAVNGKIPIYGMVGINGNIPTDGMASVSYSCANPSTLI